MLNIPERKGTHTHAQLQVKHVLLATVFSALLLSLIVPVGGLSLHPNTIFSQGTINYGKTELVRPTWWGICVWDTCDGQLYSSKYSFGEYFSQYQINMIREAGGNAIRLGLDKSAWDTGDTMNVYGKPYKEYIKQIVDECHQTGLYVMADLAFAGEAADNGLDKIKIIRNQHPTITRQDWIDWGVEVTTYLNPDAILITDEPCNEPQMVATGFTEDEYYAFAVDCVKAWRAVDPDILIATFGVPFKYVFMYYDPSYGTIEGVRCLGPLKDPDTGQPFENIVYILNYPYGGDSWGYTAEETDTEAELVACRDAMYGTFDWKLKPLKGSNQICFTSGAFKYVMDPPKNWQRFIYDVYEYCKQNNIWQLQYGMVHSIYWWAMLAEGWKSWNTIGQFWVENVP